MSITSDNATPEQGVKGGRLPRWALYTIAVSVVALIGITIAVVVVTNARPSLQSVSDGCGGDSSGIILAGDGLIVDSKVATMSTLICVTEGLLPDLKDRFAVTHAVDSGVRTVLNLNGYEITVIPVAGVGATVGFQPS